MEHKDGIGETYCKLNVTGTAYKLKETHIKERGEAMREKKESDVWGSKKSKGKCKAF